MKTRNKSQVCIKCTPEWRAWLREFARAAGIPTTDLLDSVIASFARELGYIPISRNDTYIVTLVDLESNFQTDYYSDTDGILLAYTFECTYEWREWVSEIAESQGITTHGLIDLALINAARELNIPKPPRRTRKYSVMLVS